MLIVWVFPPFRRSGSTESFRSSAALPYIYVTPHTDTVSPRSEEVTVVDVDVVVVVDIAVAAAIASAATACIALKSQIMVPTTANASHWLKYWRQPELYAHITHI